MNKAIFVLSTCLVFLALLVSSCSPGAAPSLSLTEPAGLVESSPAPTSTSTATPTEPPPVPTTTLAPTFTLTPTATPTHTPQPTDTPTLTPTDTPTLEATATITSSLPLAALSGFGANDDKKAIKVFFIQPDTGGPFCGNSLVWMNTDIQRTPSLSKNIAAALTRLFSYQNKYIGGMYNPVYAVDFKVKSVDLSPDGHLLIQLGGSFKHRSKDDCENILLREQIWSTFRQFGGFDSYTINLNNQFLGDLINTDR
jgi:hypothetical protein